LAFLLPSSAKTLILLSFNEIRAISDAAKNAFNRTNKNKNKICITNYNPPYLITKKRHNNTPSFGYYGLKW
jgi:hypothetical protein